MTCAGTGKAFSETVAARVFHDSCNAIADSMKFAYESTNGMSLSEKGKATGAVNASAECNQGLSHENSCFSASELQALAESIPDVRSGGKLYSAAMATTNNIERQKYLKAAAACLVACGKNDVYEKRVKGKLINAAGFEAMVKEDCNQCSGSGMKKQRCNDCNGNGRCSRCTAGFSQSATCSKCNSSGRCPKCSGKGYKEEKCVTCAGTGKVFNKANATRFFRDSCNVIADGNEGGSVRTNNMLGQLDDLKQRRYSLREVVSVGKAMLSTLKIPREAISHTPFYCRGSDNGLELREKVRATVKSAQTLLSDIDANKVEISKGEFEPADYIEFWHKDTTKICKQRLFDEIWEKALMLHDANNNPLSKVLLSKVPDNIVFVVNDVSLVELRRGGRAYSVKLAPLVFGEKNRTLGMVWNGRECQTKRYIELAEKAGFLARRTRGTMRLLVPTSPGNESIEDWKKGDTVISKGWMNNWTITNCEIEMTGVIFRSFRDWEEMNLHVSP
ncbi:MAG: hypothetical protein IJG84_14300 [Kiritimatiellae bacterium]|nr:hypothetical protein [Kiritimatiellia bacterium]